MSVIEAASWNTQWRSQRHEGRSRKSNAFLPSGVCDTDCRCQEPRWLHKGPLPGWLASLWNEAVGSQRSNKIWKCVLELPTYISRLVPPWLHFPSQSGPHSLPSRGTWHCLLEAKEGLLSRSPCWFLCCLSPTAELSGCNTLSLERKDPRVVSVCLDQHSCPLVPVTLGLTAYHVTCLWKAVFIKMTSVRWLSSQSNTI